MKTLRSTRIRSRSLAPSARWLASAAALLGVIACGTEDPAPADESSSSPAASDAPGDGTGALSFALTAQPGVELDAFSYAITGPHFAKTDTINVAHSSTVSALIGGIPSGSGYAITLTGKAVAPAEGNCSGSAPFAITPGAVTKVPITVSCRLSAPPPPPPPPPANVPIPLPAVVAIGCLLLGLGTAGRGRRPVDV
jgi:hypothetical protein